jgi:CRISPR-associated protein Cmr4
MYKEVGLLSLYCESPVHAGSGSDLGVIDLPIQREKTTNHPIFQGSTLKGALRASFDSKRAIKNALLNGVFENLTFGSNNEEELEDAIKLVFGDEEDQSASAISFMDAKILLFPVKAAKNVFSWVTCPNVLSRLKRDLEIAGIKSNWNIPEIEKEAVISPKLNLDEFSKESIVLEEYTYDVTKDDEVIKIANWISENIIESNDSYWESKLEEDLIILTNDEFEDFVTMSTEVIARTKIVNETKVVQDGALWYEENLPAESVLYSLAMTTNVLREDTGNINDNLKSAKDILSFFELGLQDRIQLGGNETIGRGIIKTNLQKGGSQ